MHKPGLSGSTKMLFWLKMKLFLPHAKCFALWINQTHAMFSSLTHPIAILEIQTAIITLLVQRPCHRLQFLEVMVCIVLNIIGISNSNRTSYCNGVQSRTDSYIKL